MGAEERDFGERVAAAYDEHSASMFEASVVGPAVDRLTELAGDGDMAATRVDGEFSLVYSSSTRSST